MSGEYSEGLNKSRNLGPSLYIKNAVESFRLLKENPFELLKIMTADVLFLFFIGLLSAPILNKILEYGGKLAMEVLRNIQQGKMAAIFGAELMPLTNVLVLYSLTLFILYYLIYTVFQGYAWGVTKKICNERTNMKEFITKFAKINIFWLAIFIVYKILDLFAGIRSLLLQAGGIEIADNLKISLAVLALIAYYFIPITYVHLQIKKGFLLGVKKIHKILPIFLAIIIVYLATDFFINLASSENIRFVLSFIYLPLIAWTRAYLNTTIKDAS